MKLHPANRTARDRAGSVFRFPGKATLAGLLIAGGVCAATFGEGELFAQATTPAAAPEPAAQAPADRVAVNVSITPKRLTFGRGDRSATVYIFNQGRVPATFDISMGDSVMLPTGDIRPLDDAQADPAMQPYVAKLSSAKNMILATPRRATLAPGKGQTIRIRVTPPAAGASSEYRSHLTVRTVPSRDVGLTAEDAAARGSNQLSFRITPVFGLSIPVIIRNGEADVRGDIRNARLIHAEISPDGVAPPRRTPVMAFDMTRSGNNSLFGNIEIRAKGREKEPIGFVRGLGLYTEIDHRTIQIPLQRTPARGEQLEIVFIDDDVNPGRVVARSSYTAP